MAGDEHEPQQVIPDGIVKAGLEGLHGLLLLLFQLLDQGFLLPLHQLDPPQLVDGPALGRGHEPGAGIPGNPRLGPLLQGGDEGILGELFGQVQVPHHPQEPCDEPGGFHAPDGVDGPVGVGCRHMGIRPASPAGRNLPRRPPASWRGAAGRI